MLKLQTSPVYYKKPLTQNGSKIAFRGIFSKKEKCQETIDNQKIKTSWVLDGGGAKGSFQTGVITALVNAGLKPDVVTGTSVGSLNSAFLLSGHIDKLIQIWQKMHRKLVYNIKPRDNSLLCTQPLSKLISTNIAEPRQRPLPDAEFMIQTTKISRGEKDKKVFFATKNLFNSLKVKYADNEEFEIKRLSKKNLHSVLMASCAIPYIFPAQQIDDEYYVDGGLNPNRPVRDGLMALSAIKEKDERGRVIVVLCNPEEHPGIDLDPHFDNFKDILDPKKVQTIVIGVKEKLPVKTLHFNKMVKNGPQVMRMGYDTALDSLLKAKVITKKQFDLLKSLKPFKSPKLRINLMPKDRLIEEKPSLLTKFKKLFLPNS